MVEITFILYLHFVADFIFQSEYMATNKSANNLALLNHVIVYSLVWGLGLLIYFINELDINKVYNIMIFTWLTLVAHFITDYITSRIVKKKFDKGEYGSDIPNFGGFTVIGFDQLLHYIQLLLTWEILFK